MVPTPPTHFWAPLAPCAAGRCSRDPENPLSWPPGTPQATRGKKSKQARKDSLEFPPRLWNWEIPSYVDCLLKANKTPLTGLSSQPRGQVTEGGVGGMGGVGVRMGPLPAVSLVSHTSCYPGCIHPAGTLGLLHQCPLPAHPLPRETGSHPGCVLWWSGHLLESKEGRSNFSFQSLAAFVSTPLKGGQGWPPRIMVSK